MDTARNAAFACLAATQHGAFTPRQVSEIGFSREERRTMVRNGQWVPIARSVLVVAGAPPTMQQRCWAAVLEAGDRSAISHVTAAELHRVPGFSDGAVHVTKHESRWRHLLLGELHSNARLPTEHVELLDGLPTTTIARTIFDLAGDPPAHYWGNEKLLEIHKQRIARALDTSLLRLGNTLQQQLTVNAELCRRGRPGSRIMRELLDERAGDEWTPTESELEDMFVAFCTAHDIELPLRQRDLGATRPKRVDFVYFHISLVIELDGRAYHDSKSDADEDRWRDVELAAMGLRVMRFTWRDLVHRPDWCARQLRTALARRAA